jgi:hypothetical protein
MADAATGFAAKTALMHMVRVARLAEQAERNSRLDLVYQPLPVKAEQ